MEVDIRFSSPVLDEENITLLNKNFGNKTSAVIDTLESAPQEISILACLLRRLELNIENKRESNGS